MAAMLPQERDGLPVAAVLPAELPSEDSSALDDSTLSRHDAPSRYLSPGPPNPVV
jgi:hypothetical protein